jgi:shikimate dehydrogenase
MNVYRLKRFTLPLEPSVFGIIGNPVSHSRSPETHNRLFSDASLSWIYLPFHCNDLSALLTHAPRWNAKGFSITHPWKETVIAFLDSYSPEVKELKSSNTIAYVNGRWIGTNTDLKGIHAMLADVSMDGYRIVIIGAGASARAIATVVRPRAKELLILNRTAEKGAALASEFHAASGTFSDLKNVDYDVLIQATPVGWQNEEIPDIHQALRPGKIVIDSIYRDTPLLKKARDLGCKTINGDKWFQIQAKAQFEWWQENFA